MSEVPLYHTSVSLREEAYVLLNPPTPLPEPNLSDPVRLKDPIPITYPHWKAETASAGKQSIQNSLLNPRRFEIPPEPKVGQEFSVQGYLAHKKPPPPLGLP